MYVTYSKFWLSLNQYHAYKEAISVLNTTHQRIFGNLMFSQMTVILLRGWVSQRGMIMSRREGGYGQGLSMFNFKGWVCAEVWVYPGVSRSRGWGWVPTHPRIWNLWEGVHPSLVLRVSGSHQCTYRCQADGTHPNGMFSCLTDVISKSV